MKKILTILLSLLLLLSISSCSKNEEPEKEEEESFSFSLSVEGSQNDQSYSIKSFDEHFIEALSSLKTSGNFTYEIQDGRFIMVNETKETQTSYWQIYVNQEIYEEDINELIIKDGDQILLHYVDHQEEPLTENNVESQDIHEPVLVGDWQTYETFEASLKKEDEELFNKAVEEVTGVSYLPVRLLAGQTVSGFNYAFLAQGTIMSALPETNYYIIVIYKDLEGNCEIKAINQLEIPYIETKENESENLLGAWLIYQVDETSTISDDSLQASFEKAVQDYEELSLIPVQVLGSQLVNGNNYMALVYGKTKEEKPKGDLYLLTWNQNLLGESEILELKGLNLAYYIAGE